MSLTNRCRWAAIYNMCCCVSVPGAQERRCTHMRRAGHIRLSHVLACPITNILCLCPPCIAFVTALRTGVPRASVPSGYCLLHLGYPCIYSVSVERYSGAATR